LLVVAGGLAVLCVGGLTVGYVVYDRATQPDRRTPAVVVDQYVEAMFNARDRSRADLFLCAGRKDMSEPRQLLNDLEGREKEFSTHFTVTTANVEDARRDGSAEVTVDLRLTTPVSRSTQRWTFRLTDESGWRICEAHRVE
jgi:hypothetical protein